MGLFTSSTQLFCPSKQETKELGTGLLLALSFFLLMMVGLASGSDKDQIDLSSYQGKNRILVVFSSSETDLMYKSFKIQLLRLDQEIRNRDILIIDVFESGDGWLGCIPLYREQALLLRKRFSMNMGQSALILIGKDGEVKLQKQLPVDLSDIFSIIDAMPMRQREIRERLEETLSEEGAESVIDVTSDKGG